MMTAHQRYMQYRKDELQHYNKNHDPVTGRFTSGSSSVFTSVRDIIDHVKDVETIYDSLPDKEKHFLVGDGELPKHFFKEGEQVPAMMSVTKHKQQPVSFAVAYEDGNGEVSIATATDPTYRGKGYASTGIKNVDDWFAQNPSEARKTLIWLANKNNTDSISLAEKYGYVFETENEWGGWNYYRKDRDGGFFWETTKVTDNLSNKPKPFIQNPINETEVAKRGGLNEQESRECSDIAKTVYESAKKAEPSVTRDVIKAVTSTGSNMYGLENRLKQPTSLAAKIGADAKEDKITFSEAASNVKDTIRYTSVSTNDNFVKSYRDTKTALEKAGYEELVCKNYFQKYKDGEVLHKSVQTTYRSPNGTSFEIQFQTPESQAAKNLKTPIYEERRNQGNSAKRNRELDAEMRELAERVPDPDGVFSIPSHK